MRRVPHRVLSGRSRLAAGASALAAVAVLGLPAAASAGTPAGFTAAQLARASGAVLDADVPGTAWYVDGRARTVVVTADSTVTGEEIDGIRRAAGPLAGALRFERTPGAMGEFLEGGDGIHAAPGWRCSLGFNVRDGDTYYFLTAGHCTDGDPVWKDGNGKRLGPTVESSFPENDYGLVRYEGSATPPGTANGVDITGAADARVGQRVTRDGSTTGTHSGTVTGLNATVNYGGGKYVRGLTQTDVCAEPGDSGGPFYSGNTALGLTSGGSGDCSAGGTTFFQPVTEPLRAHHVSVY